MREEEGCLGGGIERGVLSEVDEKGGAGEDERVVPY